MSESTGARPAGRILLAVGVALAFVLAGGRVFAGALTEVLWFRSVGYSGVFWTLFWLRALTVVLMGAVAGALVYWNLRGVASSLGRLRIRRRFGNLEFVEQVPRRYVVWITVGVSALLGTWFGFSAPAGTGLRALLYLRAEPWGLTDPVFGRDLGFYNFLLPLVEALVAFALVLVFLLFFMCLVGYATTGALAVQRGRLSADPKALRHLATVLAGFLGVLALQFWLGRYGLLVDGSSRVSGIFGYVDHNARVPGLAGLSLGCLVAGGTVFWAGRRGRLTPALAALGIVAGGGIILAQVFPSLIQRFEVDPNELERESPFIAWNLEATRTGFGLHELERAPFSYQEDGPVAWDRAAEQLAGVPTWNQEALLATFQSLEARFRYYRFSSVTIDRYETGSGVAPVALSVRELNPSGIENPNWQNLHLRERFVQGVGAVMTSATEATSEGRPEMFLASIPPEPTNAAAAPTDIALTHPGVFFGPTDQQYAIVTPGADQFLAPDGSPGTIGTDLPQGIPLRSRALRLLLAWGFQDPNLFFSSEIGPESQFVIYRGIQSRVQRIAPFLAYLEGPQATIHDGRVVWILDGFTSSAHYPLSSRFTVSFRRAVNYLRASVKVTVDAVTGDVRFFIADPEDPILAAYAQVFPDLFRPLDEMDPELRDHLRYPKSLLTVQAGVLQTYHQETPAQFHGQEDVWTNPQETGRGTSSIEYRPEYARYRLPGSDEPEFLLSTVFVPVGLQNLTAALIARSDPGVYGQLRMFEFRVEDGVPGPRQVEALIEQDPTISQQFSLWRQGGSQVWTGHLHLIPVGDRILYMEPVFLAAEEDAIPELRRFVVSDGTRVAMEETLSGALAALSGGVAQASPASTEGPQVPLVSGDALELLNAAEQALRDGDWAGFGDALERLRQVLESRPPAGPTSPPTGSP